MQTSDDWALLQEYGSLLEANLDLGALELENVPTMVRGLEPGIWGPGFNGLTLRGVSVFVPSSLLDYARDLIGQDPLDTELE